MGEGGGQAITYLLPPSLARVTQVLRFSLLTHTHTHTQRERERVIMADAFVEVGVPGQRSVGGIRFPVVLAPVTATAGLDLHRFTEALRVQKARVEALLRASGAVLLRGFPVRTAADFDAAVEAFGYEDQPYIGGAAPRTHIIGRVFTANESPPDQNIHFHHEMSHVPEFPSKLFFFCEEEPRSGGETPIVLSHRICERMREKYPDFVERLDRHGIIYTRVLGAGDDPSSPIGRGWQSTFLTKDRSTAEERARTLGIKLEWTEDGVKAIMGPIPAIKFDASRQHNIWFNSMVAAYTGWKDARNDPVRVVTFGDGSLLPSEVIDGCLKILEEECVAMPWQQGDILLLDNLAVLHARRSFDPPRRILVSMCK